MSTFNLTPDDHREIAKETARLVVELLQAKPPAKPSSDVLTLAEAKVYVRRPSRSSFFEWCKRWKVKPHARGRYGKAVLDLALQREGGAAHIPATLVAHQAALK